MQIGVHQMDIMLTGERGAGRVRQQIKIGQVDDLTQSFLKQKTKFV